MFPPQVQMNQAWWGANPWDANDRSVCFPFAVGHPFGYHDRCGRAYRPLGQGPDTVRQVTPQEACQPALLKPSWFYKQRDIAWLKDIELYPRYSYKVERTDVAARPVSIGLEPRNPR